MTPCLDDEGCNLLVNQSGWTCTQPGGRVKTTTVRAESEFIWPCWRDSHESSHPTFYWNVLCHLEKRIRFTKWGVSLSLQQVMFLVSLSPESFRFRSGFPIMPWGLTVSWEPGCKNRDALILWRYRYLRLHEITATWDQVREKLIHIFLEILSFMTSFKCTKALMWHHALQIFRCCNLTCRVVSMLIQQPNHWLSYGVYLCGDSSIVLIVFNTFCSFQQQQPRLIKHY